MEDHDVRSNSTITTDPPTPVTVRGRRHSARLLPVGVRPPRGFARPPSGFGVLPGERGPAVACAVGARRSRSRRKNVKPSPARLADGSSAKRPTAGISSALLAAMPKASGIRFRGRHPPVHRRGTAARRADLGRFLDLMPARCGLGGTGAIGSSARAATCCRGWRCGPRRWRWWRRTLAGVLRGGSDGRRGRRCCEQSAGRFWRTRCPTSASSANGHAGGAAPWSAEVPVCAHHDGAHQIFAFTAMTLTRSGSATPGAEGGRARLPRFRAHGLGQDGRRSGGSWTRGPIMLARTEDSPHADSRSCGSEVLP